MLSFPLGLISFHQRGWWLLGWDNSLWIPDWVWPLSFQPCLGPQMGWNGGSCCWNFGLCSPCWVKAVLGALGGCGWPGSQSRSILLLWGHALSQEVGEVCRQVRFSTQFIIHLELDLLPQVLLFLWGGISSPCTVLWVPRLGLQLEASHGAVELLIRKGTGASLGMKGRDYVTTSAQSFP